MKTADNKNAKEILKARAAHLACEDQNFHTEDCNSLEIVEFVCGQEKYAVENKYVEEVLRINDFTPLPGIPSYVIGIVNVRGRVVSIINFKEYFGLESKGLGELNRILLLKNSEMEFAILADSVKGIKTVSLSAMQRSEPAKLAIDQKFIIGITSDNVIVLDGSEILNDERLIVNDGK